MKETVINNIIRQATRLGACRLTESVNDIQSLASLFYRPQGREFCINNSFPSLEDFRSMDADICRQNAVWVDSTVNLHNVRRCAIVNSVAELTYSGTDAANVVVLMHGSKATIKIRNYAVVKVEKAEDCKVTIINEDNTGIAI